MYVYVPTTNAQHVAIPYMGPAADAIPNALDALKSGIMAKQQQKSLDETSILSVAGPNAQ